ncbi:MAG: hypothetical protein M3171_14335 [Actinomycetota bacterium]|nr:hypothetical protein [Actinomycetota bacterium]
MSDEDTNQPAVDSRLKTGEEIQAACDAVLAAGLSTDRDVLLARLQEELTRRGHWPQPPAWLDSVVAETQLGHHYRVIAT